MAFEVDYEKVNSVGGWFGGRDAEYKSKKSGSYTHEFFGTISWVFLAHLASVFELGDGFKWGLAWVIATTVFRGHFNAMTTLLSMCMGDDPLECFIRLVLQMVAGFVGYNLFYHLGFTDWAVWDKATLSLIETTEAGTAFSTSGLANWGRLLVTLLVYFGAGARLNTGHKWIDNILLLGITFAVGGKGFAFAPNRWWFCQGTGGAWVKAAKGFGWDYLAYAIMGFIAKYLVRLVPAPFYDGDKAFNWDLPAHGPTSPELANLN